jgi:hypothetical protein
MSKVILSIAALITSLSLAWTAYNGVEIRHTGDLNSRVSLHTDTLYLTHDGYIGHY